MIPVRILGTGSAFLGPPRSTAEIAALALPGRDPADVERKIGIRSRRWAPPGTTAAALGAAALAEALAAAGLAARDLRRIVFCSTAGGDAISPATANAIADALGLDGTCDAFDVNNACTGFLTALDVAARSIATGLGPVGVVASEVFSRWLEPERPRPFLVLGDAAGAAVLGPGRPGEGLVATAFRNDAALRGRIRIDYPAGWRRPPAIDFDASNEAMTASALDAMRAAAASVTAAAGVALADVEWFLPHQPNGRMLDLVLDALRIDRRRVVSVVDEIGSVGAASIPVSLDRLLRARAVRPGHRVLMVAVGGGTSSGAVLYRAAPASSTEAA